MYGLDTHVIAELRQGRPKQPAQVRPWAAGQQARQLFLSAISILELEKGVMSLQKNDDRRAPPQGATLRVWPTGVRATFAGRILPFTDSTATLCAAVHVPNPRSDRDDMIAAAALDYGMTVVTRNVAGFVGTGVQLVNPFD